MRDPTVELLIVTQDAEIFGKMRAALDPAGIAVRMERAATIEEARQRAWAGDPDLIVLDETALRGLTERSAGESPRFEAAVTLLAGLAPLLVLASPERQGELAPLLAAGAADFVARAGDFLPCAMALLERRLYQKQSEGPLPRSSRAGAESASGDFGEILRHELNNPLTGILGNAELLLAEIRRHPQGPLPAGAQQRLETITDLAVRLRETVRRLSQRWDERHTHARR